MGVWLVLRGEGYLVDGLDPHDAAHDDQQSREVVHDLVAHASPLVDPETVVNGPHLLLLLQLSIAFWDGNLLFRDAPLGAGGEGATQQGQQAGRGVHLYFSLVEVNQAILAW